MKIKLTNISVFKVVAIDNFANAVKDPTGKTSYPVSLNRLIIQTYTLKHSRCIKVETVR